MTLSTQTPTRTGYDFLGWGTSSTDTTVDYNAGASYTTNANLTLYAIWKPHTYAVYYHANGGANAPSGQTKLHDVDLPLQTDIPTRTFYRFLGWATTPDSSTPIYQAGDVYTNNVAVTLYAVWELTYVKPRIENLKVQRWSNGKVDDFGTDVKISFDWETDLVSSRYAVYYKEKDGATTYTANAVNVGTTSGSVNDYIKVASGNVKFDTEKTYMIQVNVADENGYTSKTVTLNASFIPIDATEDGKIGGRAGL